MNLSFDIKKSGEFCNRVLIWPLTNFARHVFVTSFIFILVPQWAFASVNSKACSALFVDPIESLPNVEIAFKWVEAIEQIKKPVYYFDFDKRLFYSMMKRSEQLNPKQRKQLLGLLGEGYHNLVKNPNRRSVEWLITKVGRFDRLFDEKINEGLSPVEAFDFVHKSIRQIIGNAPAYDVNSMLSVGVAVRKILKPGESAFLYGSAVTGKSVVGKSDLDVRYIHLQTNAKPFEKRLKETILATLLPRYELKTLEIQAFDETVNAGYNKHDILLEIGKLGPFVIEVRYDGIFLYVFEPPEIVYEAPPESRKWQFSYKINPKTYKQFKLL